MSKIIDAKIEVNEIIRDISNHRDIMFIYDFITDDEKLKCTLNFLEKDESDRTLLFEISDESSLDNFKKLLKQKENLNIFNGRRSLSFVSTFVKDPKRNITQVLFNYPNEIIQYERRKTPRVQLSQPIVVNIKLTFKTYRKNVFDLGEGGFSIIFIKSESVRLEEKMVIPNISFFIGKTKIVLDCEVAKVFSIKPYEFENFPYGGTRVSFKYLNLTKENLKEIATYMQNYDIFKT